MAKRTFARGILALCAALWLTACSNSAAQSPAQATAAAGTAVARAPATATAQATTLPTVTPALQPTDTPHATAVPTGTPAPAPTDKAPAPTNTAPPAAPPAQASGKLTPTPDSVQQAFIDRVLPLAQAEQADSGVPVSFSVALSAAETGWGASVLMKEHNNYHQISCSKPNEGLACVPYGDGMWNAYSSPLQAFLWQGRWMRAQHGFDAAFQHTDDVATFTRLAAPCFVSCSGPYPQRFVEGIMGIVDQYNLRQYDVKP